MKAGWISAGVYWCAAAALALPLGLVVLTSLADSPLAGFPLGGISLRWYAAALADPENRRAFLLSAGLAAAVAVLATAAGTWIALAASMLPPRWRWLLLAGTLAPLVQPGIVHAISLRIAIQSAGLAPGVLPLLLGHTVHATPLAAIMVAARLGTTPQALLDAARDLGAGPVQRAWHVQLVWLGPALAGAACLAALNSFDDVVRSFFLGGYDMTLPVLLFGRMRSGLTPEINAVATLSLLAVATLAGIAVLGARLWVRSRHILGGTPMRSDPRIMDRTVS